jgi:hypothetical protein
VSGQGVKVVTRCDYGFSAEFPADGNDTIDGCDSFIALLTIIDVAIDFVRTPNNGVFASKPQLKVLWDTGFSGGASFQDANTPK